MNTDRFRSAGGFADTIALIDTGVNPHVLLPPGRVTVTDMVPRTPAVTTDICDHGTRSAAAMVGGNALGDRLRGITDLTVHMYQVGVFTTNPDGTRGCGTDSVAATAALGRAVQDGFKVIVAETQFPLGPDSVLGRTADNAFRSGAVVIGAAGNTDGSAGSVQGPANARNVLGIGSVNVETFAADPGQGRGPTDDGRIKPDLVTPTDYETGVGTSNTATERYGGTSGATAAAGGTVAALRRSLRGNLADVEPGRVYAGLIAGGSHVHPFDNGEGAGKLKLHSGAISTFKATVSQGSVIDLPFTVTTSSCRLTGAIWWPTQAATGPTNADSDVDLVLIDPSGNIVSDSRSGPSVFELARVTAPAVGRWKLRLLGFSMAGPQDVYAAATTCR